MIFGDELAWRIMEGATTELRRPVDAQAPDREPYKVGRRYPVQYRRKRTHEDGLGDGSDLVLVTIGQVEVVQQERSTLDAMTNKDAKRSRYRSLAAFRLAWEEAHGTWDPEAPVWVVSIEPATQADKPLFLARPVLGKSGDYTRNPKRAIDEAEVLDDVALRQFAEEARRRAEILQAERIAETRARSLAKRVREEALASGRAGVDVSAELDAIADQVAEIERKREQAA